VSGKLSIIDLISVDALSKRVWLIIFWNAFASKEVIDFKQLIKKG
jgi:hypothetical protein